MKRNQSSGQNFHHQDNRRRRVERNASENGQGACLGDSYFHSFEGIARSAQGEDGEITEPSMACKA
jgi:hypothetical protein